MNTVQLALSVMKIMQFILIRPHAFFNSHDEKCPGEYEYPPAGLAGFCCGTAVILVSF